MRPAPRLASSLSTTQSRNRMPNTFAFTLSEAQANTVLHALAQQPYAAVATTIADIQKQAAEQIKAAEAVQDGG